ncbi:MAG TPA: glycosyl hydrolase family 18 protein [Thermoleophilaceae bacterium]|jgi:spore germination protein YaaH
MRRLVLVLAVLAATFAAATAPASAARISCDRNAGLGFERAPGRTAGTLTWSRRPSAAKGTRYRVFRNGAVVGQTRGLKMRVRVRIGGTYTFAVRPVSKRGKVARCGQRLRRKVAYVRPGRATAIGATNPAGAASVRLSWEPATRGDGRLVGYRVFRDGATVGQTAETGIDVRISSNRRYELRVAAVDSRGTLGALSDAVTVETGHEPPPAPTGLSASDVDAGAVTLSWAASAPPRGRVVGYRVFRDDRLVRQVQGTSFRLTNLAAQTTHGLTVVAVDSLGYLSPPSAPLAVTTARPEQTAGRAHAFLLASTDRSFEDLQANYRRIGTVYPTYYDCSATAAVTGRDDPLVTNWSLQRGLRVLPRFNCQRNTVLNRVLNEPALREAWIARILELVETHGYSGANLDFETGYGTDRDAYTSFVAELAQRLHDRGKLLSIAVSAKRADVANHPRSTFFDYIALSQHADTIFVMAWGFHWTTSGPGAPDDIEWVKGVVNYVKTMPNRHRFVLGSPIYGMDWAGDGGSDQPADHYEHEDVMALAARVGATPTRDAATDTMHFDYVDERGTPHQVWYADATTLATRIALAREAGIGTGFWRLGREDQRLWSDPLLVP